MKIRRPLPFSVVAGAAWLLCAAQAALGVGESLVLCPFRLVTGHRCPGCGMGHAVVAAMRGDWVGSFHLHPLGIPLLAVWTAWLAVVAVKTLIDSLGGGYVEKNSRCGVRVRAGLARLGVRAG